MTRELTDEEFVEALRLCRLADAAAEGGQTPAGHYLGKLRDLLAPDQAALDHEYRELFEAADKHCGCLGGQLHGRQP